MAAIRDTFFPTPNHQYKFVGIYLLLCLIYTVLGIKYTKGVVKMVLKVLPVAFLVVFFLYTASSLHVGPVIPVGNVENLERLIAGLIFSCLGDCYLVFDSFFIHGLLSFACAQMVYTGMFTGGFLLFTPPTRSELLVAVAIGLVSLLIYSYILPKLSCGLVIPVAMYCVLISLMVWHAIVAMQQGIFPSSRQGAVGACLFYTSDVILGVSRWRLQMSHGPHLVIVTYYTAQLLIFLSVINSF